MPTTNRPFFANFFAAFRAHSALQKASPAINASATSSSGTLTTAASAAAVSNGQSYLQQQAQLSTSSNPSHAASTATPTHHKSAHSSSPSASAAVATAVASAPQTHFRASRPLHAPTGTPHSRTHSTSPLPPSRSPDPYGYGGSSPGQSSPFGRSSTPSQTPSGGPNPQFPYSPTYGPAQQRQRRGSDTSEGSGHSAATGMWGGAEKWYIGGRTAAGEERFYKLGLVRKYDSADRLSLDRLSL